ncbi:hypothetical protein [Streptomyces sp. NPDC048603]|uniref:hypothetical protein n=1 Tax=Streptomyces sp. NPDC048603 TaxID=3365577 RepID=UPI00372006F5
MLILITSSTSIALAGAKPPDPYPEELRHFRVGIHKVTGEYCNLEDTNEEARKQCREPTGCEEKPAHSPCLEDDALTPEGQHAADMDRLRRWRAENKGDPDYDKLNAFLTECVEKNRKPFQSCHLDAGKLATSPAVKWAEGQISKMAADALEEAAGMLGSSVIWLLNQFAEGFNDISTVKLADTGIGKALGITWGISALVAAFLLLLQFGKVGVSQSGGPAATAIIGLAKWAAILAVYLAATQSALSWSDTLSEELIKFTIGGTGEESAEAAMKEKLGTMFGGLVGGGSVEPLIHGTAVSTEIIGFVIVMSVLCLLAVGALYIEMLVRQAAILLLVVSMPIVLAGQMADATRDWWPKARNALITIILVKPVIVLCFSVGFLIMTDAKGVKNVLVGLMIFILAGVSWPVLARFMTFTSAGDGNSVGSGLLDGVGSSLSSKFGGSPAAPSGAGTVGGGSDYTKALESDSPGGGGGGGFWSKAGGKASGAAKTAGKGAGVGAAVAAGLQIAAAGKNMTEGAMANMAAHAGLGAPASGAGHVNLRSRNPEGGQDTEAPQQPPKDIPSQQGGPRTPATPAIQAAPAQPAIEQSPPAQLPSQPKVIKGEVVSSTPNGLPPRPGKNGG